MRVGRLTDARECGFNGVFGFGETGKKGACGDERRVRFRIGFASQTGLVRVRKAFDHRRMLPLESGIRRLGGGGVREIIVFFHR